MPVVEPAVTVNINTLLLGMMTMLGTGFGAWLTYRANATHKAVNSERSAMTEELKKQNLVIAQLAAHLGALSGSPELVELARTVVPAVTIPTARAAALAPLLGAAPAAPGSVLAQIVVPGPPPPTP